MSCAHTPNQTQAVVCNICPLCGGPNECRPSKTGSFAGQACWCTTVRFSKELLDKVPLEQQGKACICKRCATKSTDERRQQ